LLSEAEEDKKTTLTELARRGGKAPKVDALSELIRERVRKYPRLGVMQLLADLAGELGAGVVTSIDKPSDVLADETPCIHYVSDDGKPKAASIRALKDRLSRAKKIKNSL
jgi:hypothetical protein